ncbi:hypothetical protein Hanom_Chr10g00909731 [Helianthus anomalus]
MQIYQSAKLFWIQKVKRCKKELKKSWKQNREEKRLVFVEANCDMDWGTDGAMGTL